MPRAERRIYQPGSTITRAIVEFHTDDGFDGEVRGSHPDVGSIISVSTTKAFGGASGTFSITMKKPQKKFDKRSLLRLWPDPEDVWVAIYFIVDGQRIDTLLGLVDSINENVQRSGEGARSETYTISGRDFGKIFETTTAFLNVFQPSVIQSLRGIADLGQHFVGGTPEVYIRTLIDTWIGNSGLPSQLWRLPNSMSSGSFYGILNLNTIQRMGAVNGYCLDPTIFYPSDNGTVLWDLMQQYSNGILNELWCDLAPAPGDLHNLEYMTPAVYLRERMFPIKGDASRWNALRLRTLEVGDVKDRNITKGSPSSRFNYWVLDLFNLGTGIGAADVVQSLTGVPPTHPGSIPIINEKSILRHGCRRWFQRSEFLPLNDDRPDSPHPHGPGAIVLAANWLKRIHDWYSIAPMQLSGTLVTTRVMPEIRIGERVREKRAEGNITYYVEGVEHEWSYPGPGRTTLTVTRGEYDTDRLLDTVYRDFASPPAEDLSVSTARVSEVSSEIDWILGATGESMSPDLVLQGHVAEGAPIGMSDDYPQDPEMIPREDSLSVQGGLAAVQLSSLPVPPTPVTTGEATPTNNDPLYGASDVVLTPDMLGSGANIHLPADSLVTTPEVYYPGSYERLYGPNTVPPTDAGPDE